MSHQRAAMPGNQIPQVDQTSQVDQTQAPALAGAKGIVLANGKFQCTATDHTRRDNSAAKTECGSIMANNKKNIQSHLNKLHNPHSTYTTSQASFAKAQNLKQLVCDRPRLDGQGWCTSSRWGVHSLVAHARNHHKFRGKSASLTTPWAGLSDNQRAYYVERVNLEVRRQQNGGVFTPEDEALNKRFEEEKFPDDS